MPVINSLAGFALAAALGLGGILGLLLGMCALERRMLRAPRRPPVARVLAARVYRLGISVLALALAACTLGIERPRGIAAEGGPGAMRRPRRISASGSRRSRNRAKPRS